MTICIYSWGKGGSFSGTSSMGQNIQLGVEENEKRRILIPDIFFQ